MHVYCIFFFQLKAPEGSELRHIYGKPSSSSARLPKANICSTSPSKPCILCTISSWIVSPRHRERRPGQHRSRVTGWTLELHKCQYIECTNPFCRYNDGNDSCDRNDPDRKRQIQNACHHWWMCCCCFAPHSCHHCHHLVLQEKKEERVCQYISCSTRSHGSRG